MRQDKGTTISQAVTAVKRHFNGAGGSLHRAITDCADTFAKDDFEQGVSQLIRLIHLLPADSITANGKVMLDECALRLETFKDTRGEYVLLALHTLDVATL